MEMGGGAEGQVDGGESDVGSPDPGHVFRVDSQHPGPEERPELVPSGRVPFQQQGQPGRRGRIFPIVSSGGTGKQGGGHVLRDSVNDPRPAGLHHPVLEAAREETLSRLVPEVRMRDAQTPHQDSQDLSAGWQAGGSLAIGHSRILLHLSPTGCALLAWFAVTRHTYHSWTGIFPRPQTRPSAPPPHPPPVWDGCRYECRRHCQRTCRPGQPSRSCRS